MSKKMVTVSTIKERGWTDGMVARHQGEPDVYANNPRYSSAAPMRLFSLCRVEALEKTEAVAAEVAKTLTNRERRKAAAKRGVTTKRSNLLARVAAMEVSVAKLTSEKLLKGAIDSYNVWNEHDEWSCWRCLDGLDCYFEERFATENCDPAFLRRISVNFLRHEMTSYDEKLEETAGRVGRADAVKEIRRRVYLAIATAYPALADECASQFRHRHGSPLVEGGAS